MISDDRVQQSFYINSSDLELKTMDLLMQVMECFERDHENFALQGDVEVTTNRIACWFGDHYHVD